MNELQFKEDIRRQDIARYRVQLKMELRRKEINFNNEDPTELLEELNR